MEGCCPPLLDCGIARHARCATFQTGRPRSDNASVRSQSVMSPRSQESLDSLALSPRRVTPFMELLLPPAARHVRRHAHELGYTDRYRGKCAGSISSPRGYLACSTAVRYSFLVDAREVLLIACGVEFCLTCLQIVAGNAHRTDRATASGRASYE